MHEDHKYLVLALVVMVVLGVISFAFGEITGEVARNYEKKLTKVYISSDPFIQDETLPRLNPGDFLYITVETGSAAITDKIRFYEQVESNFRKRADTYLGCSGYSCRPNKIITKEFKIPSLWEGKYCVRNYDREFKKDVEACFIIR